MSKKRLKKLNSFVSAIALLSSLAFSAPGECGERWATANVRDSGGDLALGSVRLKDLTSAEGFEGKFFKVVKGASSEVVRFNDSPDLTLRAATAYHHLTIARDYFAKQTELKQPHLNDQITVRIEHDRQFSQFIHFRNADADPNFSLFNLSMTVPGSNDYTDEGTAPWGVEIWYHQAKPVDRETQLEKLGQAINNRQFKNLLLTGLLGSDLLTAVGFYLEDKVFDDLDLKYTAYSVALSVALTEVIPWTFDLTMRLFSGDYSLDTVMIPELSYHEYAHVALAEYFGIFEPSAIVEGYPNYFASKISGLTKLGDRAGDYNNGDVPKDGTSEMGYTFEQDNHTRLAHGSFVMSLLLDLEKGLGERGHLLLSRALKHLNGKSKVKGDFQKALIRAINETAKTENERRILRTKMNAVFQKRKI